MNTKHYLVMSGIVGGIIGSLLTTLFVSPVTAQRDNFGDIECTKLTVADAGGTLRAVLGIDRTAALSVRMAKTANRGRRSVSVTTAGLSLPLAKTANRWRRSISLTTVETYSPWTDTGT